jgi:hypothetical protein
MYADERIPEMYCQDSNFLDIIEPVPNAIYTMDKAYVDFKALFLINQCDSFFITRAKDTMRYEIVETNYNTSFSIFLLFHYIGSNVVF